jgi:hypothetical protein
MVFYTFFTSEFFGSLAYRCLTDDPTPKKQCDVDAIFGKKYSRKKNKEGAALGGPNSG